MFIENVQIDENFNRKFIDNKICLKKNLSITKIFFKANYKKNSILHNFLIIKNFYGKFINNKILYTIAFTFKTKQKKIYR